MKTPILLLCLGLISYALPGLACPKNPNDPFAIEAAISSGPHKGECINTDRYRSGIRLTLEQLKQFLTADEVTQLSDRGIDLDSSNLEFMANFSHVDAQKNEHFFVAIIPVERVEKAEMQMTRLSKILPIEHGQIRLILTETGRPVVLIDQTVATERAMLELHDDIVMTVSGVRPIDHEEPYNAFKGLLPGYYDEEFQIGSNEDLDIDWITPAKLRTKEYSLNITTEQAQNALRTGLTLATENSVTYSYSTLTSSCLNISFLIFHDVLGTSDRGTFRKIVQSINPVWALKHLGLINKDGSSYIDTLPLANVSPQASGDSVPSPNP
jgi:hypothetical protein